MKLGGSVLTDKAAYRTPRMDVIARLARELAQPSEPVVLVHGAGSFGHVLAKRHDLSRGDDGDAARREAFARVLDDVRALDGLVRGALLDAGVRAVSHSTLDLALLAHGGLARLDLEPVRRSVALGMTPVLRGDGAYDTERGFGILSGDVLMVELARALKPTLAVFVTDVDGIYDRAPDEPGARLLERVSAAAFAAEGKARGAGRGQAASAPRVDERTRGADVTGGMRGKVERAAQVAREGVPVLVLNGLAEGRLAEALSGGSRVGSVVEP